MRRCLVVVITVFAATLIAIPRASAGDAPIGHPVSTVVLLDKKTGYHLAQWNL